MKILKRILVFLVTVSIFVTLSGCGSKKLEMADLVGEWCSNWEFEGRDIMCNITLDAKGNYKTETYSDNKPSRSERGRYGIEENKLLLYDEDTLWTNPESGKEEYGGWTSYDYKGGKLYNGNHKFSKVN